MEMVPYDYNTINLKKLRALPTFKEGAYHLDSLARVGNGCFLDAPGYPSYYTRNVWNSRGDHPRNGPYNVITDPETGLHHIVDDIDLRTLWVPITYPKLERGDFLFSQHPFISHLTLRLHKWIRYAYIYFQHCYASPENGAEWRHAAKLIIHTTPCVPGHPVWCPEQHAAVLAIQDFYPEHKPDEQWINIVPASEKQNDWWERYSDPTLVVKPAEAAAYR